MPDTIVSPSSDAINALLIPDSLKPEILAQLIEARGDQGGKMFDTLLAMNAKSPTTQPEFSTFTAGFIYESFHSNGIVAAAATQVITLTAGDIVNGSSYVRVGDVVRYPNATPLSQDVTGVVTVVTSPVTTITVRSLTATNLPALVAGETLTIISHISGSGGTTPKGLFRLYDKDTFKTQIWSESVQQAGGSEALWWTTNSLGKNAMTPYILGVWEASVRMALAQSAQGLYGQSNTVSITDPDTTTNGNPAPYITSEGYINYIKRKGHTDTYTPGLMSLLDFYAVDETIIQEFTGNDIMVWNGDKASNEKDQVLQNYLKNTNVQFATDHLKEKYFAGNSKLVANLGFNGLVFNERNYYFQQQPLFWNPKQGGAAGYKDRYTMLFQPMGQSSSNTGYLPTINYRYRSYANNNRMMEIWQTGGSGGNSSTYTNDTDTSKHNIRAEGGFEFTAGNQLFGLFSV